MEYILRKRGGGGRIALVNKGKVQVHHQEGLLQVLLQL